MSSDIDWHSLCRLIAPKGCYAATIRYTSLSLSMSITCKGEHVSWCDNAIQWMSLFHALMPSKMPAMTLWPPGAWWRNCLCLTSGTFTKGRLKWCLPAREDHANLQGILTSTWTKPEETTCLTIRWNLMKSVAFRSTGNLPSTSLLGRCISRFKFHTRDVLKWVVLGLGRVGIESATDTSCCARNVPYTTRLSPVSNLCSASSSVHELWTEVNGNKFLMACWAAVSTCPWWTRMFILTWWRMIQGWFKDCQGLDEQNQRKKKEKAAIRICLLGGRSFMKTNPQQNANNEANNKIYFFKTMWICSTHAT